MFASLLTTNAMLGISEEGFRWATERLPRVAAAASVASRSWRDVIAAATCLVVPVLLAVALLPNQRAANTVGHGLLAEFRAVSIASQLLFWGALTAVGALLLRRRA